MTRWLGLKCIRPPGALFVSVGTGLARCCLAARLPDRGVLSFGSTAIQGRRARCIGDHAPTPREALAGGPRPLRSDAVLARVPRQIIAHWLYKPLPTCFVVGTTDSSYWNEHGRQGSRLVYAFRT